MSHDTGFPTWRLVAGVVVTSCLLLSFAWAADQGTGVVGYSYQKQVIARVGAVQGDTKVQRAGEAQFKKIAVKAPLYVMDFLATGKNSKLWWHGTFNAFSPSEKWKPGPDVTEGSLAADSVFGFKQFERAGASYRFVGYVQKGTVRFIKTLPNTNPPSTFTIGTHTAWIEVLPSDRAADYIVESKNESLTTVTVLWGKVRVKNVSPEIKESRILTSCQEVDVERDQEPGEIKWVSTDTMKELVKRTTIPKTLPEDVPSCERLKTEVILDLTDVYLPPPGVALYPAIVPVPVPVPGDKECCPPGKTYDRRTGKCVCECPEGERPPVTVNSTNGFTGNGPAISIGPGPCGSCRRGSTFNQETCSCECPCPQGFLLPGQGCVSQCPEGYTEAYDSSNSPPYRCRYCVQQPPGIVVDPIPPPLRQCQDGAQCDNCESCVDGTCVPRVCKTGFYLDRGTCQCEPVDGRVPRGCQSDQQCSRCQQCREGQCVSVIVCGPEQRLNLETCQCEPTGSKLCPGVVCGPNQKLNVDTCQCESSATPVIPRPNRPETPEVQHSIGTGTPVSEALPECQANKDCGSGQICRKGKCVKKPPPRRSIPPSEETETFTQPSTGSRIRIGPQFGTGSGSFGTGGSQGGTGTGGTQQLVPHLAPPKVAPVQRVPRRGRAN